jgi:hypothetical protein
MHITEIVDIELEQATASLQFAARIRDMAVRFAKKQEKNVRLQREALAQKRIQAHQEKQTASVRAQKRTYYEQKLRKVKDMVRHYEEQLSSATRS